MVNENHASLMRIFEHSSFKRLPTVQAHGESFSLLSMPDKSVDVSTCDKRGFLNLLKAQNRTKILTIERLGSYSNNNWNTAESLKGFESLFQGKSNLENQFQRDKVFAINYTSNK